MQVVEIFESDPVLKFLMERKINMVEIDRHQALALQRHHNSPYYAQSPIASAVVDALISDRLSEVRNG